MAVVVNQSHLVTVLRSLYPNEKICVNDVQEFTNPTTKHPLEVDAWVPSLQLCFEFQDMYHYSTTFYSNITLQKIQNRDNWKREQLHKRKETLIAVPYWWAGDSESLISTIEFYRPDLQATNEQYDHIPFNPIYQTDNNVPDIGELMLASFPEHLNLPAISEPIWWIGEKYDGIRFCWNPVARVIYSRRGIPLSVTPNLHQNFNFGKYFIDGEFWSGRGKFQESVRLIHPQPHINMALSKFVAFDMPNSSLQNERYETRYAHLLSTISSNHPLLILPERTICDSTELLASILKQIKEFEGEGVVLYKRYSSYSPGRSNLLFKIKSETAIDEEALVVESNHVNIKLQLPRGDTFAIPQTHTTTEIKKGSVVTVSSAHHSQLHLPVNPIILRVRDDVTWEQVLAKYYVPVRKVKRKKTLTNREIFETKFSQKPKGYWRNTQNQRNYVIQLARHAGFDPLDPKQWKKGYSSVAQKLSTHKIAKYHGTVHKALRDLFPEINLKNKSLVIKQVTKTETRKRLIEFAKRKGIDPLVPESWYNFKFKIDESTSTIRSLFEEGFKYQWVKGVIEAFPDISLDPSQFRHNTMNKRSNYWQDEQNQRSFFIHFAKRNGFDPLVPHNWYKIDKTVIENTKYGKNVLDNFAGNFSTAISTLFNEHWDQNKEVISEEKRISL